MKIEIKKKTEQLVEMEIATPAYFKNRHDTFAMITESHIITVSARCIMHGKAGQYIYNSEVPEFIAEGTPCSQEEFEEQMATALGVMQEIANVEFQTV